MIGFILFGPRLKNLRRRFLELRADGLAIGPSPVRLDLHRWTDIIGLRLITQVNEGSSKSTEEGTPVRIEIVLRNGDMLALENVYDKPLKQLSELLAAPGVLDL